jgi:hypothetical protein
MLPTLTVTVSSSRCRVSSSSATHRSRSNPASTGSSNDAACSGDVTSTRASTAPSSSVTHVGHTPPGARAKAVDTSGSSVRTSTIPVNPCSPSTGPLPPVDTQNSAPKGAASVSSDQPAADHRFTPRRSTSEGRCGAKRHTTSGTARTSKALRAQRFGKKIPSSRMADSVESEPWMMFSPISVAKSPRIEPGADSIGLVAPAS